MKTFWEKTPAEVWQGRNDLEESATALRVFQSIIKEESFNPEKYPEQIALLGFCCDEGVRINKGITGAKKSPDILKKALANFAYHPHPLSLIDMGNIICNGLLSEGQQLLTKYVEQCHSQSMKTLVIGGGHETAFAHGMGLYNSYPDATIGIINLDAHLDIRSNNKYSSGTPFLQLFEYCKSNNRNFNYLCIGASKAANTQALLETAENLNVRIIWDTECQYLHLDHINQQILDFIATTDIIYLTIDLDVLPPSSMFAVSAPSSLGVDATLLHQLLPVISGTNKLAGADVVEFNPLLDRDSLCARVAARFVWELFYHWK
ncbi:formimidoylglutamase [Apibacter raozihei]|uniref:formimidoylglutamase n=1 Tax=Apibacter raozihei TaxID=2500547 RepID=UPI000FE36D43|nr:formimidoylglutamase [Apibacter raozihei]